jgi:hypothetical protein
MAKVLTHRPHWLLWGRLLFMFSRLTQCHPSILIHAVLHQFSTVAVFLVMVVTGQHLWARRNGTLEAVDWSGTRWWEFLGGPLGATELTSRAFIAQRIGLTSQAVCNITGQVNLLVSPCSVCTNNDTRMLCSVMCMLNYMHVVQYNLHLGHVLYVCIRACSDLDISCFQERYMFVCAHVCMRLVVRTILEICNYPGAFATVMLHAYVHLNIC